MTKIEQLENEITQKNHELNETFNTQQLLIEALISNTTTLKYIKDQLKKIEGDLKYSNEYVYKLQQENRRLKLSCDKWMKLSIKFKLEAINTRNMSKNRN